MSSMFRPGERRNCKPKNAMDPAVCQKLPKKFPYRRLLPHSSSEKTTLVAGNTPFD
jgi:hypothetical protein